MKTTKKTVAKRSTKLSKKVPAKKSSSTPGRIVSEFGKQHSDMGLVSGAASFQVKSNVTVWVDTGDEQLNSVLGDPDKGIPGGRIIELYSAESHGKTTIALWLLGLFQRADGLAIFADVESTYDEAWAKKQGVDTDDLLILQLGDRLVSKNTYEPEGMEDLFEKMASVARICREDNPEMPVILAWDSVAATPTRKELAGDYADEGYALQARALSKGLRKLYGELRGSGVVLLCINQTRTVIGGYRPYQETPGGKALKFYSSVRAKVQRVRKLETQGVIECELRNVKNKISPPFQMNKLSIDFQRGLRWVKTKKKKKP